MSVPLAVLALGGLLVAGLAVPGPAQAFGLGPHEQLTGEALGFLAPAVLSDINGEHTYQDTAHALSPTHHFDNCEFSRSTSYLNARYGDVAGGFRPAGPDPFAATDGFGQILHTTQDFYAHSNWVELGRTDLVDARLGPRAPMAPWSSVRPGVIVAEGETLPAGWSARLDGGSTVPTVTTPAGTSQALISGWVDYEFDDECLDAISLGHWARGGRPGLHKDASDRPGFPAARALAVRQTQHEWCRLLHLSRARHGYPGASVPMGLWVAPGGSPHPAGSECAKGSDDPGHGTYDVTVTVPQAKIVENEDGFGAEANLSLVVYRGDFRDSSRVHAGPFDTRDNSSVPAAIRGGLRVTLHCVDPARQVVATLQGWDDDGGADGVFDDAPGDPDDPYAGVTAGFTSSGAGFQQHSGSSKNLNATFDVSTSSNSQC